jgi:hypothetical protein
LQAHNPNYLKSSPSSSRQANDNDDYDNIDDIPIAELNLDVPLKVHCKFMLLVLTLNFELIKLI